MDAAATTEAFRLIQLYLLAASLALARIISMMLVMPVFSRLGLNGLVRNGISLALAIPIIPTIFNGLAGEPLSLGVVAALLLKEAVVGILVGLVVGVPIYAAEFAGDVMDLQRGSTGAFLSDPAGSMQASITGTLLALIMTALYFASGCFSLTLRALYDSYNIWPVRRFLPLFSPEAGDLVLHLLDLIFKMGIMLAAPVMICLLLVDMLFALVSRASPQLQVFFLSLGAKTLVFALLLVLYSAFLFSYMEKDLVMLLDTNGRLEAIAPHEAPH